MSYTALVFASFKHFLGAETSQRQRLRIFIAFLAFAAMIAITVTFQLSYDSRPLQVRELAGREVSMEKLADIFLGMDQMALENHYRTIWTYNGIVFLGALLLLKSLKDATKK